MDIMKKYINMLNFGIDLKMTNIEEEYYFLSRFTDWLNDDGFNVANFINSTTVEVTTKDKLSLIVQVKNSTLTMEPKSDEAQDAIMMVIKFIAEEYDNVRDDFQELVMETKKIVPKKEETKKKDDGDDDFEWI